MIFDLKKYIFFIFWVFSYWIGFSQLTTDSVFISRIEILGNEKTKDRIILRELSLESEKSYTKAALDSVFEWDKNRIYNTNLFNSVNLELSDVKNGEAVVTILVEERWYFYPIPIFKLIDRNFNDWWVNRNRDLSRVNYGIRLSKFNFRGRGELLRLILQSGFTSAVNIEYNIPYIDKKQNQGLFFDLSYIESKSVAYNTRDNIPAFTSNLESDLRKAYVNAMGHRYRSSFYTFHFTSLGHYHIAIADTLAKLNPNYLGNGRTLQRYFYFGHSFRYDKRNNINYTTEGTRLTAGLFKHGLGIHKDGVNYWRARFKMAKYWDLKNNWYAASDVSILATFPERRDYFNYYKIGLIPETLRGYDLVVVEGSSYAIQRNELKYQFFSRKYDISKAMPLKQFAVFPISIYWKLFYDQGYSRGYPAHTGSRPLSDSYLYSFGSGVDFLLINDITLRLEFSRNAQSQTHFFINFLALI